MKKALIRKMRCTNCGSTRIMLEEVIKSNNQEILEGSLTCDNCGKEFKIKDGIPIFVNSEDVSKDPRIRIFHEYSDRYEGWFSSEKGKVLFEIEIKALNELIKNINLGESLEVGVGTGAFAQALGIEFGIDPAWNALLIAKSKGIEVIQSVAENMPFKNESFDSVFLIVTICYVSDPDKVIREIRRVLRRNGFLIIAFIDRESAWGRLYLKKKLSGHIFYKHAHFYTYKEVSSFLVYNKFKIVRIVSTLRQQPSERPVFEHPIIGHVKEASFITVLAQKGVNNRNQW